MLSFATPLWLLGLLLVPVIRWLHRSGPHLRPVPVSSLGLWRRAAATSAAAGKRRHPDPAWRRRALLAALLCIALSGPKVQQTQGRVTVWVDDSLSMLTLETRATRLAEGLAQIRAALAGHPRAEVEVRPLSDPWRRLTSLDDATVANIVAGAGKIEPAAPPAALLRSDSLHWLLTDGADAALFDWPGSARPDRVFQLARVTRNVGLERLAARRNLDDPDRYDLLLKVTNGGDTTELRDVIVTSPAGEITRSSHRLEPGGFGLVNAGVAAPGTVRVTLQPADALVTDDVIVLDLDVLRRHPVTADPGCPPALLAAVRAHPALAIVDQGSDVAEAALECGSSPRSTDIATICVIADRLPTKPLAPLRWSPSVAKSSRLQLDAGLLQVAARIDPRPGDAVLLAAGDEPLIIRRTGTPAVIETALDFAFAEATRRPETPLLLDFMFESLLGHDLLDDIAIVDRGPNAAMVVPVTQARARVEAGAPTRLHARDLAWPLLLAALLVLLWEIIALSRQWHRLRVHAKAMSA